MTPVFAPFEAIYEGTQVAPDGTIDERVWFKYQIELDMDERTVTYLVFPYGAKEEEFHEITIQATIPWTD